MTHYRKTARGIATDPVAGDEERTRVAIGALEKLLQRQKSELQETETLLSELRNEDGRSQLEDEEVSSLAKSMLSGVDYGFRSRSEGAASGLAGGFAVDGTEAKGPTFEGYGPPGNIMVLGWQQLMRNLYAIIGEYKDEADIELTLKQIELQEKLETLTLNSTAIWDRELADGPIEAPFLIKIPYLVLCWFLDTVFEGKYVPSRLFYLETVARMPYFSYIGMLHFYETLGFWRRSSDIKRIHFAEEWNEFAHLQVMESLGGDQKWWVRFLAQHSAIAYFFVLCFLWAFSPTLSYKFSELLETHAVNTYGQFLDENEEVLLDLPPSVAAVDYYCFGRSDPFFGEYQTTALALGGEIRRPGDNMKSLYDVFAAIKADEGDHVGTMKACLDPDVAVQSPSLERKVLVGFAMAAAVTYALNGGDFSGVNEMGDVVDSYSNGAAVSDVATGLLDGSMVEAAIAGAAGLAKRFIEDEEDGNTLALAGDFIEANGIGVALEGLKKLLIDGLTLIAEFLAALL